MSNSTRSVDVLETRPAQGAEIESAVAILLSSIEGRASTEQIQTFIAMAAQRGMNLDDLWIARQGDQIHWAMLPVVSPGRTMLLLSPPTVPKHVPLESISAVIEAACEFHRKQGVHLAQLLIDPAEMSLRASYLQTGFTYLAELVYLSREVKKAVPFPPLPPGLQLLSYTPQTHAIFVHTIARSYEQSLDCPGLSGLRDMEDVILGHKGAGDFDPALWFAVTANGQPLGVLLLGLATHADALELVYLGLAPEARRKGLGELLMKLALLSVIRHNRSELTLAVDARNVPAMRLYFRHGMRRMGSRAAMIRVLTSGV